LVAIARRRRHQNDASQYDRDILRLDVTSYRPVRFARVNQGGDRDKDPGSRIRCRSLDDADAIRIASYMARLAATNCA
jgi:hypothetical protein